MTAVIGLALPAAIRDTPTRPEMPIGTSHGCRFHHAGSVGQREVDPGHYMHVRRVLAALLLGQSLAGCQQIGAPLPGDGPPVGYFDPSSAVAGPPPSPVDAAALPNPLPLRTADPELLWNQLVDTVDDYFSIATERRMQRVGGILQEGFIETRTEPGATWLEPWRWDSVSSEQRSLATLQSIRRKAFVRVVPMGGQYQVFVQVQNELEDVTQPIRLTPGASTPRYDGTLIRKVATPDVEPTTKGWIGIGRDSALEQEILRELQGRLSMAPPSATPAHWLGGRGTSWP